jgi:excisionase family DNA binding protein
MHPGERNSMEAMKQPTEATKVKQLAVEKEWLTYRDIRLYCNISRWTILRAVQDGDLQASRVGRKVLVRRADLDAFIEARATENR